MIPRSRPPTAHFVPRKSGRNASSHDTKKASASRWTISGSGGTAHFLGPCPRPIQPQLGRRIKIIRRRGQRTPLHEWRQSGPFECWAGPRGHVSGRALTAWAQGPALRFRRDASPPVRHFSARNERAPCSWPRPFFRINSSSELVSTFAEATTKSLPSITATQISTDCSSVIRCGP